MSLLLSENENTQLKSENQVQLLYQQLSELQKGLTQANQNIIDRDK